MMRAWPKSSSCGVASECLDGRVEEESNGLNGIGDEGNGIGQERGKEEVRGKRKQEGKGEKKKKMG